MNVGATSTSFSSGTTSYSSGNHTTASSNSGSIFTPAPQTETAGILA